MFMKRLMTLLCFVLCACLSGAFYYVSPDGNDRHPGNDPAKPLKSLTRALKKVTPGDTVMVKGGIYREQLWREWKKKNPAPVTIKAFPDETPVITFAWAVKNWKKVPGGLLTADFPYAVCDLWQRLTLDRYLKVDSMELLKKQPGAFLQDPKTGKLYVNPLNGSWHDDPEKAGFTAIPYGTGRLPYPFDSKAPRVRRSGLSLVGDNLVIDGLSFEFHSAAGFTMRGRKIDNFYGSAQVRNCSAVGTTLGFSSGWVVADTVIENCRAVRNSGGGIQLGNYIKNIKIRNNFLLNNGSCLPFYGDYTAGSGNVYNLSRYGGAEAEYVDFTGNKVFSLDKSRKAGLMRCKGGIHKHTNQLNNLYVGGSVSLYSVPGSTATLKNNTVLPGKFYFTVPTSGEKYTPDMQDNLELSHNWKRVSRFANPEKYDFRLLPDSKHLGKGYAPGVAPVWFVKGGAAKNGSGRIPESPLNSLAQLQKRIKSGDTVYFLPGNYTGKLVLKNLKNVVLSDMTFNKARYTSGAVEIVNSQNIKFEHLDFCNIPFTLLNSTVEFSESFLTGVKVVAVNGKVLFANSSFENSFVKSSGRVVLRENLIRRVRVEAGDVVSEHNGFAEAKELAAWPFKETFKSFAAGENGRVPLKNLLCGSKGTWIGRRVIRDILPPVQVEYLKFAPLDCGTKCIVSWNTPKDYVQAVINVFDGKKHIFSHRGGWGEYLTTSGEIAIPGLKKGKTYTAQVYFKRHNESNVWKKNVTFTMPAKSVKHTPELIKAGVGTKNPDIAAVIRSARKGDTIFIMPGVYSEMINVYADDLTIKAKPGTVKISGAYMFDYCLRASDVKGLTLDGLDFIGLRYSSKTRAVEILKSEKIKVLNCRFFPGIKGRMGNVQFFGRFVKGVEVRNCVFNTGFHAVWFMEADDVIVDHNTFWGVGINAIHIGGGPGARVVMTNNLCEDVVSNHKSPAISIGDPGTKFVCDWNLYWKTEKKCPGQKIFGLGGKIGTAAVWQVMNRDVTQTLDETRKRFKIEKNGLFADPKMKNPAKGDFTLAPDSPARKRGSDGRDIGADLSVFADK